MPTKTKDVKDVKEVKEEIVNPEKVNAIVKPKKEDKVIAKAGKRSAKAIKEDEVKQAKEARKAKTSENPEEKIVKPAVIATRSKLERRSKNYKTKSELIDKSKLYKVADALDLAQKTNYVKFDASVELHINLNIDPRHADQNIRDTLVLPAGTGKKVIVAALTEEIVTAKNAGADITGTDNIFAMLDKNQLDFDVLVASPQLMSKLGKYSRLLGPRGLMPNPKSGTVTNDITKAVSEAKAGKIEYRVDSSGIVHVAVGKVSFKKEDLVANASSVLASIKNNKPQSVKSNYIKAIYVTTTMGPSIKVDLSDI
jgi:large subunit ribosomal protein L1